MTAADAAILARLRAVRELIADPAHWTQGADARSAKGRPCNCDSPCAVRWCVIGALNKIAGGFYTGEPAVALLRQRTNGATIVDFNDTHSHAEVLALLDAAIARVEGSGEAGRC